ncbi:hypothetical protein LAZ67_2005052 [Cordylochernes scorpioides]|uniref:Transposase n=1 Tax=Cordylochernes scorpioides TaxID=51811 RepID=A0ABY6K5N6_9ARAC|nr:hypothetical protein LAZ67_2005052 [Cordylochernes scorpioides]
MIFTLPKRSGKETGLSVYMGIMRCLREAVRLKRPERWQNNDWILHVGNARPHTAHVVLQFLAKHSTIQIPHPPYSPDLAPNDFFLYPKLKMNLKGRKFDNVDMIQAESKATLKNLSKSDFISCFDNWKIRWNGKVVNERDNQEISLSVQGQMRSYDTAALCPSVSSRLRRFLLRGSPNLSSVALLCSSTLQSTQGRPRTTAQVFTLFYIPRPISTDIYKHLPQETGPQQSAIPTLVPDGKQLPKTTIYRVKRQFDEADSKQRGDSYKEKALASIGQGAIAKEMDVGSMTIVRTIHEDLGLKSYALRKGQLLTENMKNNRKGKAAALLNNLKHDSFGMLRFFSDEKNFDLDQKVNPRNDRWICKDPSEIPVVMHTKFPASVMVLGVISSEGDVMPLHFFEKGLRMNADTYINVLETVVKPWMDMVAAGRKYVFQQDSAPAHKAKKTQSWLTLNVPSHWGPDIWPPNSPDCNPLDYYVWGVVERDVNKAPHTTIQSVKKAVHTVMTQMDKVIVAKACASFRTRLETVVANNGNYIE